MKHTKSLALMVTICAASMGCSGAPTSEGAESKAVDDPVYPLTFVQLNPDGTQTIQHFTVTRSQQIANNLKATQQATQGGPAKIGVIQDTVVQEPTSSCVVNGAYLTFWDQTNCTGATICFGGSGTISLSSYALGTGNWSGAIRGDSTGFYSGDWNDTGGLDYAFSSLTTSCPAPSAAQQAVSVTF